MNSQLFRVIIAIYVIDICGPDRFTPKVAVAEQSNRISRLRGNILRNLTRTHEYEDNIVTSQLDASSGLRQAYRAIRDLYNKCIQI